MTATPDGTEGEGRPAASTAVRAEKSRAEARQTEIRLTESRRAEQRMGAALQRAWGVLMWERIWPAIVAVSAALGLFLIASWLGLWLALPPLGRIVGLVLFAALFALALVPALRIRPPSSGEALSRLDRESRLPHRPATALSDHLASKPDDPVGVALWRAHLGRMSAQISQLRVGLPAPGVAAKDGQALRALVLLGVIATFFMVPGDHLRRVAAAFDWQALIPAKPYRIDAWVTPPGYTGRAPVMLPGLRSQEIAQGGTGNASPDAADGSSFEATAMTVPAGSELVVRIIGLDDARLVTQGGIAAAPPKESEPAAAPTAAPAAVQKAPSTAPGAAGDERRFVIATDGSARVEGPDGRFVSWHFRAQPDNPPTIELTKEPQASGNNALALSYKAEDDYGVAGAEARFKSLPPPAPLHALKNAAKPAEARPLVEAPNFPLPLAGGRAKTATGQTTKDFTENPWAGTRVEMTLVARDQAGHVGQSRPRSLTLPQRDFSNPLARALIEERRTLALDANQRARVEAGLDALAIAPELFTPDPSHYMGLRTASFRLANARSDDDLRGVVDYLWEMAVRIEDGDLSDVEKRLRDAQQALQNALENNAPDEEIKRLAQELRDAMNEFMKALAQEAQRNQNRADANQPMDPNTRTVRPQDLQKMLDRIEDMARNGARDAARQMLSELQNMLNGLQAGRQQQRQQQGQSQMSQSMDQLGDMIRRQQQLRDRTFKEGREGQQDQAFNDLKQNQEQLREQLRQLREKMQQAMRGQQGQGEQGEGGQQPGENGQGQQGQGQQGQGQQGQGQGQGRGQGQGMPGDGGFGQAEQAMREAEQALGEGDGTGAVDAQSEALQALRRGAQQMAEAMQQQQGGPGGEGPGGPSGQSAERTDPLGRPMRSRDYGDDNTVKVPEEIDMQRARRVLEELRRRFGEPDRPRLELDYLERLLRDF
ncbi:TIGR02302 family protein [Ancylobacter sp.]|uniref:TIGR02302 family protein n=1 Tax=Ancylobacter sp. TaxID=1872567 RepID=UPI003D0F233B